MHVCVAVTVSCLCRLIVCEEMCEILHHMYVLQAGSLQCASSFIMLIRPLGKKLNFLQAVAYTNLKITASSSATVALISVCSVCVCIVARQMWLQLHLQGFSLSIESRSLL